MESIRNASPSDTGVTTAAVAERDYFSIGQAAALLGVSRVTIWRWIRDGRFPVARLGHRTSRIKREDLERALLPDGPGGSRSWAARPPSIGKSAVDGATREHGPRSAWPGLTGSEHLVQFYETDAFLLDAVVDFIGAALRAGDAGIVFATPAHREQLAERFRAYGLDLDAASGLGRYVALDAAEMLAQCMLDGEPEPGRFAEVVGGVITRAAEGGRRVRVFGEMVALLVAGGNQAAALRLEGLWNELQQQRTFSLLCGYPMDRLGGAALDELVDDICAEHSRVVPADSYTALDGPDDRLRAVALLQQKARSLDLEVAERQRAEVLLAGQRAVLELIARGRPLGQTLEALARLIEAQSEGLLCSILLLDREGLHLRHGAAPSLPDAYTRAIDGMAIGPAAGCCGTAAYRGEPVVVADIAADPLWADFRALALPHGLRACWSTPIRGPDGRVVGTFAVYHHEPGSPGPQDRALVDVLTYLAGIAIARHRHEEERAELLERERAARAEAEAAVRTRDEFLAAASHDLKNPLAAIKGTAQMLQRTLVRTGAAPADRLAAALVGIIGNADQMTAQLNELLDVAHLEMGRPLVLERSPTDLVGLARQQVAAHQATSEQHRLRLETTEPELLGAWDAVRLARVIGNLLANAIKYSPDGGEVAVLVGREPARLGSGPGWAVLRVRDQGIGIPAADLTHIFERFHRAANAVGRVSGTGIGLSSARQIAEQHGGTVLAEGREGHGTTVTVRLPVEAPEA